ncbi:MAG: hypothetical protein JWR69_1909 [Pedosphaera sp.]|nr:hypothetical protein [Pedosphaera sp.]
MKNHPSRRLLNVLSFPGHSKAWLLFTIMALVALNSSGQVYTNFFDDFETGNLSQFTLFGGTTTPLVISTPTNKIPTGGTYSAKMTNSSCRMYANLTNATTSESFKFTYYYNDVGGTAARGWCEVRAYANGAFTNGSLNQLLSIGKNNTITPVITGSTEAYDVTKYQGRIANGNPFGNFNLNLPGAPGRSTGWHRFDIERGRNDDGTINLSWYVDGVLGRAFTNSTTLKWDDIVMGPGLGTTAGDAYFDGFKFVQGEAYISTQPQNTSSSVGTDASLTVTAIGDAGPLSYQWRKNGTNINGATDAVLTIVNPQLTDSGNYTVVVTNILDVKTSAVAVLTITPLIEITTQPTNQIVNVGSDATFFVAATGNGTLTYQWKKNGTSIPSATADTFTITPVAAGDAGSYTVVVHNGIDPDTTSNPAVLTVNTAPILTTIANQTGNVGILFNIQPSVTDDFSSAAVPFANFESFANGIRAMFNHPDFSGTTTNYLDLTAPSFSLVTNAFPGGHASSKVLMAHWTFAQTGTWLRFTTSGANGGVTNLPNPIISFQQALRFDIYSDKDLGLALGVRETSPTGAIGADAGSSSGAIEFVGVTAPNSPPQVTRTIVASNWTTVNFDMSNEPAGNFNAGNNLLDSTTGKGTLEMLALTPAGGAGVYNLYLDNFVVVPASPITFSLDAAPPGANIDLATGFITWTPPAVGTYGFTVRATDTGTLFDTKSFSLTVSDATPPGVVSISSDGSGLTLNWSGTFTLQSSANVTGPYTDVPGPVTTGPFTTTVSGTAKFFRLRN